MNTTNNFMKSKSSEELHRLASANTKTVQVFERHPIGTAIMLLLVPLYFGGLYLLWPFPSSQSKMILLFILVLPIQIFRYFNQGGKPVLTLTATGIKFGMDETELPWNSLRELHVETFGPFRTTLYITLQEGVTLYTPTDRRIKYRMKRDEVKIALESFDVDGNGIEQLLKGYQQSAQARAELSYATPAAAATSVMPYSAASANMTDAGFVMHSEQKDEDPGLMAGKPVEPQKENAFEMENRKRSAWNLQVKLLNYVVLLFIFVVGISGYGYFTLHKNAGLSQNISKESEYFQRILPVVHSVPIVLENFDSESLEHISSTEKHLAEMKRYIDSLRRDSYVHRRQDIVDFFNLIDEMERDFLKRKELVINFESSIKSVYTYFEKFHAAIAKLATIAEKRKDSELLIHILHIKKYFYEIKDYAYTIKVQNYSVNVGSINEMIKIIEELKHKYELEISTTESRDMSDTISNLLDLSMKMISSIESCTSIKNKIRSSRSPSDSIKSKVMRSHMNIDILLGDARRYFRNEIVTSSSDSKEKFLIVAGILFGASLILLFLAIYSYTSYNRRQNGV